MADSRTTLTEKMVLASTDFGLHVVKEVAQQAIAKKPTMSLREFMVLLDQYTKQTKEAAAKGVSSRLI